MVTYIYKHIRMSLSELLPNQCTCMGKEPIPFGNTGMVENSISQLFNCFNISVVTASIQDDTNLLSVRPAVGELIRGCKLPWQFSKLCKYFIYRLVLSKFKFMQQEYFFRFDFKLFLFFYITGPADLAQNGSTWPIFLQPWNDLQQTGWEIVWKTAVYIL